MTTGDAASMRYTLRKSAIAVRWGILSFAVVLPALGGCATRYEIGVTTYLSHDLPFPPASASTKIAVVTESDPDEPLLEVEVKGKMEALVTRGGFGLAPQSEATHVLVAHFAIDDGTQHITSNVHYSSKGVIARPYSYTSFTRFLGVSLYEKERWLASEEDDLADAIVWRATTTSAGSSSDLRGVVDYLLVTTFDYFGEDTGKRKQKTLREGDSRVRRLRKRTSAPGTERR